MRFLLLLLAVGYASSLTLSDKSDACSDVWCKAGRECVVLAGKGECMCIVTCPDHLKPVCGSDGESYDSHCKLHQQACLTNRHIKIEHKGYCKNKNFSKKMKKNHEKIRKLRLQHELANDLARDIHNAEKKHTIKKDNDPLPAVCYSPQRDALRFLLVEHWEETLKNQSWYREGMTFKDNLWGRFFVCDTDRNNYVTPQEIMACSSDVPFFARPGQDSKTTKALCIDALVDDGDKSRDYRMDFEEFSRVLNPDYKPKTKKCSLEGKKFVDGDEVHLDCNHCICAVGKWVCAATSCKSEDSRATHVDHINAFNNHIDHDDHEENDFKWDVNQLKQAHNGKHRMQNKQNNHYQSKKSKDMETSHGGVEKTIRDIEKLKRNHKMEKYWENQLFEKPISKKHQKKMAYKYGKKSHKKHHNKKFNKKF